MILWVYQQSKHQIDGTIFSFSAGERTIATLFVSLLYLQKGLKSSYLSINPIIIAISGLTYFVVKKDDWMKSHEISLLLRKEKQPDIVGTKKIIDTVGL
jgi:hypothetical protein